jgi:hypothetical protein
MLVTLSILGLGLGVAACVSSQPRQRRTSWQEQRSTLLQERAAFDFSCSKDQLRMQELGQEFTVGVTGCGRRAVYVYDYGHDAWFMNGAVDSAAGPPGSTAADATKSPPSALREDATGNPGGTTP